MRLAPFLSGGRHLRPERSPFPRVAHAAHSGLLAPGGPWRCHTQASANVKSTHARPRAPARPRRRRLRPLVSPSSCALGWLGDPRRGWPGGAVSCRTHQGCAADGARRARPVREPLLCLHVGFSPGSAPAPRGGSVRRTRRPRLLCPGDPAPPQVSLGFAFQVFGNSRVSSKYLNVPAVVGSSESVRPGPRRLQEEPGFFFLHLSLVVWF